MYSKIYKFLREKYIIFPWNQWFPELKKTYFCKIAKVVKVSQYTKIMHLVRYNVKLLGKVLIKFLLKIQGTPLWTVSSHVYEKSLLHIMGDILTRRSDHHPARDPAYRGYSKRSTNLAPNCRTRYTRVIHPYIPGRWTPGAHKGQPPLHTDHRIQRTGFRV
jgi:hypothetical protein